MGLSSFVGESINGDWTLKIEDLVAGNQGAFNNFSFEICTTDGDVFIQEGIASQFSIYPNPSRGNVNLVVNV